MQRSLTKLIAIILTCFTSVFAINANPVTGEFVDEELVLKDVSGNRHIINQYLEDGVSVILNFSSTWCRPCWKYEQRGILEVVYNAFGPNGSNQVVVLLLEADPRTSDGCMYGQEDCNDFSYGDWTQKPYPTISLPEKYLFLNQTYKVSYFPSIIGISAKDKSIHNLGQMNLDKWKEWILKQNEPLVQSLIRPAVYLRNRPMSVESKLERIRRAVIHDKVQNTPSKEQVQKIEIGVFPNPCAEIVHLEIPEDCNGAMVTFYNSEGKEVHNNLPKYVPAGTSKISVKHLRNGVYYLQVKARDFTAKNKFIVII